MEAILSADNSLNQDEINWAIRNIPNEGASGRKFDHTKDDILGACGFTDKDFELLAAEIRELKEKTEGTRNSNLIETILNYGSERVHTYLIIRGACEMAKKDDDDPMEKLRKLLDKL